MNLSSFFKIAGREKKKERGQRAGTKHHGHDTLTHSAPGGVPVSPKGSSEKDSKKDKSSRGSKKEEKDKAQLPSVPEAPHDVPIDVKDENTSEESPSSTSGSDETASPRSKPNPLKQAQAPVSLPAKPRPENFGGLQRFIQRETLGYGSFGCVHRVLHRESTREFACKVLQKEKVVKKKQVQHLKNETTILLTIQSSFIIRMHTSYVDDRNIYLILEYCDGGELFHLLRRSGRLAPNVARFYAAEVILALSYLHSYRIAFRDLKPENILLNRKGHAKLCDFGFAKVVTDRTWTLCGTPEYLAPEVITGIGHDPAVDWWAIGVLIFEMMAGYPPFYGEQPFEIYEKICDCTYRFPSSFDMISKDIIARFLTPQKHLRLGNSGAGVTMIKKHAFFQSIDWGKLEKLEVDPPVVPPVPPSLPQSFFRERVAEYDEYSLTRAPGTEDPYKDLFAEFDLERSD